MTILFYFFTILSTDSYALKCDGSNYKDFIWNKKLTDSLVRKNKEGCQLPRFDFGRQNLKNAYFHKANLNGSVLSGCNLEKANFNKATLIKTSIRYANLTKAKFEEADLTKADLTGSDLTKAKFHYAYLNEATLLNVKAIGTSFCAADLTESVFSRGYQNKTDVTNAKFNMADISGVYFGKIYFGNGTNLRGHDHDDSTVIALDPGLLDYLGALPSKDCVKIR